LWKIVMYLRVQTVRKSIICAVTLLLLGSKHNSDIFITNRRIKRKRRSQWPWGLRRGSAATRLLESRVRIPPGS
jgi:hypothetical protein